MFNGFEFLSIWWTFPALAVSCLLMRRYGPRAVRAIFRLRRECFSSVSPSEWINVGIAVCFFGSIVDNSYWFIPWSLKYSGLPFGDLFDTGVYINVPFRQTPLILGAALHVMAESLAHPEELERRRRLSVLWRTFWISSLVGLFVTLGLTFIKLS